MEFIGVLLGNLSPKVEISTALVLFSLSYISFQKKTCLYLNYISGASNLNRIIYEIGNHYFLQYLFKLTMECLLPICNSCWTSATDTLLDFPALLHHIQVSQSICHYFICGFSKKLLFVKLILVLQTFTGQSQVTKSTARFKAYSLQWQ